MKELVQGQEKIQKICDEIRLGTLEPAKKEAESIILEGTSRAELIVIEAEKKAEKLIQEARLLIEQEQNVFHSSLTQAIKQGLEALKQEIEHQLFNDQLSDLVKKGTTQPDLLAKLIDCLMKAIEKEGLSANIEAIIPKDVPADQVNLLLGKQVLEKLKNHSVLLGSFEGGVQLKVKDKGITIDMTDQALKELLSRYIRKDFRKLIFAND